MFRKFMSLVVFAAALLCAPGCEMIEEAMDPENAPGINDPTSDDYDPRFVVGVFTIVKYPRATKLERELATNTGESIWINSNQNFSSKHLKEAKVVPRPGNPDICDLKFRLDRAGRSQWEVLVGNHRGEEVVLVVDGRYMAQFIPENLDENNRSWVTVRVGIDSYTARGIAKFAKKNYTHYNPDSSSFFSKL